MSLVSSLAFLLRSAALCFLFTTAASAHLSVPFTRQRSTARSLDGSSATVPVTTASGHSFVVNVKVGTPPQSLSLLLSPSSPHTWVPNAEAMPCMTGHDPLEGFHSADDGSTGTSSACYLGVFSASKSSTAKMAEQIFLDFVVAYTDTINVSGVNMTDKFVLGDIELDDLPMGLVTSTSNQQWIGMLGLGNDAATNFPRPSSKYRPNFMDRLVSSGKIATQAYSIWLNDAEGKSGNLLLGAIDTSRYEGDLVRLHAAKDPYDVFPSAFRVPLTSVNIDGDGANFKYSDPPIIASLSPAETFSYLPDGLAEGIMTASGATWNATLQRATIACDAGSKKSKTSLRFQLEGPNGPVLNVGVGDLVIPEHVSRWELAYDSLATLSRNTCLFGIQKYPSLRDSSTPQHNLGSSLLRRTYLVFDAANKDVALAPVPSNTETTPAIVPFEKLGARIPSSRFYCVGDDFSCREPNGGPGSTTSSSETSNNAEQKNDNWKKIVIGVVVPVGILAILAPIIYVLITRRRKRSRGKLLSAGSTLRKETESTDEVNSFRDDEYGVKVTVSVTGKVETRKGPLPSPGLYPSSGLCPSPGLSPAQYWGDGILRATSSGGASGKSGESEGWKEVYNVGK